MPCSIGGEPYVALQTLKNKGVGCVSTPIYPKPYTATKNDRCLRDFQNDTYITIDFLMHYDYNKPPVAAQMLQALLLYGPLTIGIGVYDDALMYYTGGIYSQFKKCNNKNNYPNHAVLLVGAYVNYYVVSLI